MDGMGDKSSNASSTICTSTQSDKTDSPFQKAESLDKRLKLFVWGESGVGKTTLALQFPRPAVIDLEGGTDLYAGAFDFDVIRVTTADEVAEAVGWLRTNSHPYRTLIVDPITVYWESLQQKWSSIFLRRNKNSKGHKFEFYDLQPRDWMTVKAEFKDLARQLVGLDLNVIVTARAKVQYADSGFMQAVGHTFDCEKSLPYLFDAIVRLHRDDQGRFVGTCMKDRSNQLPRGEFEASYGLFEQAFGEDALARPARPAALATQDQVQQLEDHIERFRMTPQQVSRRLASHDAGSLEELTQENAQRILNMFEPALANEGGAAHHTEE